MERAVGTQGSRERELTRAFRSLFATLRESGYSWEALCPERLRQYRGAAATGFDPLTRCFGLGLPVAAEDLELEGLEPVNVAWLQSARPAISRCGEYFVAHEHWLERAPSGASYVYASAESFSLARELERYAPALRGKRVLDLGSGAGVLSFALAPFVREILGLESSAEAVLWSRASAQAQGLDQVRFVQAAVGTAAAEAAAGPEPWDAVVFNPPMALPSPGSDRPYRDGGRLGIEWPLRFLQFAGEHVRKDGQALFLTTNPITKGRGVFFENLDRKVWLVQEQRCLNEHFNHGLYRKENYAGQGIERVELWFLALRRR